MSNRSDNNLVRDIKERISIIQLIEKYISLKQAGKDFIGLCPFHDDKNPSMRVSEDRGLYHCFSCGAGGDVFGFHMQYNNIDFPQTLKELSQIAGIEYSRNKYEKSSKSKSFNPEILYKLNSSATKFFIKYLLQHPKLKDIEKYLYSRGLNSETIKIFDIGCSSENWDELLRIIKEKKISLKLAVKAGLIVKKKDEDKYFDRFRGRIIFPIYDLNGKVSGFGGRSMIDDNPKYLNSPESEIYNKSKILYGLNVTRHEIRKKSSALLVEGYMDLLVLYSHGFKNVVATLGTSLTSDQAKLLKRFTDKVIIIFDGDKPGIEASFRAMNIFLKDGMSPYIITMPEGEDPASFVVKYKEDAFKNLFKKARPILEFFFEHNVNNFKNNTISRSSSVKDILSTLSVMSDTLERSHYIKRVAEKFGLREDEVFSRLENRSVDNQNTLQVKNALMGSYEFMFLKVLLKYPLLKEQIIEDDLTELINNESIKKILDIYLESDEDVSSIINYFNNQKEQVILSELIMSMDEIDNEELGNKIFLDCYKRIKLSSVKKELKEIQSDLASNDEIENQKELLHKYRDLVELEKELNGQIYKI